MENQSQLQMKSRIMRRVHFIYYCRACLSKTALKIYLVLILVVGLLQNVSFGTVLNNMPSFEYGFDGVSYFYKYAFMHTEFVVQSSLVLLVFFAGYLARDIFTLRQSREV